MKTVSKTSELSAIVTLVSALASGIGALPAHAADRDPAAVAATPARSQMTAEIPSDRMANRLGTYLGIGDPNPGLLGLNVAYNVTDFLRTNVGYSHSSSSGLATMTGGLIPDASSTTLSAGVKGLMPGWSLSPAVGLNYAHVSYSGDNLLEVNGFKESGGHLYATVGLDYQSKAGFNGGIGYSQSFRSGVGGGMYLNAGWFFNVLN